MVTTKIIAIDGPAAGGKGTIAKRLAAALDFAHMDTGALYRLVGWHVLQTGGDPNNEADAIAAAQALQHSYDPTMSDNPDIRTAAAGNAASKAGFFPGVRQALHDLQLNFAHHPPNGKAGAVLDGRDIGTVICPEADVKFFITANVDIRTKRRFEELKAKGHNVTYDTILADMIERDARDSGREAAPLRPADDAIVIDTSEMSIEDVMERAMGVIHTVL